MFAVTSLAILALAIGVRADLVISTPGSATQVSVRADFLPFSFFFSFLGTSAPW
jgi:hypothetical protein